jgi:hypothetical protein
MRILSYECKGVNSSDMSFDKVELAEINLLVGDTGTGKTRFLNTIFNLGRGAVSQVWPYWGYWDVTVEKQDDKYRWIIDAKPSSKGETVIEREVLTRTDSNGKCYNIIERDTSRFIFKSKELPKLSKNVSSIYLLREEDEISPIYKGFSLMMRRNFSQDEMTKNSEYELLPIEMINRVNKIQNIEDLFRIDLSVNARLFFLSEKFKDVFAKIVRNFREVYPFISDVKVLDATELNPTNVFAGKIPVFCIKEENISNWVEYKYLSSGMQKVLLILTDVFMLPNGGIYLIDEYENSLGINSINFLPSFLLASETPNQFIITSHHPYLINNIPVNNWYVFHRKGTKVSIQYGPKLVERFGKSKQQVFLQLINDPFYSKGIE